MTGISASDSYGMKNVAFFESLFIAAAQVMKILPNSFGEPETVKNSVMLTLHLDKKK
jgi:hypothetical protein